MASCADGTICRRIRLTRPETVGQSTVDELIFNRIWRPQTGPTLVTKLALIRGGRSLRQADQWLLHHGRGHDLSGIDRICERIPKTPIRAEVEDSYYQAKKRIQIREHALDTALRSLK